MNDLVVALSFHPDSAVLVLGLLSFVILVAKNSERNPTIKVREK